MGQVFRYVDGASLEAHRHRDLPCPLCEGTAEVYPFYAEPEGGYITEACRRCIRSLPLDRIVAWDSERRAADHLREVAPALSAADLEARRAALCEELRRTPRVPAFVQDDEWPLCCGDFAEYVGRPGLPEGWDGLGGLSLFRCPRCGQDFEVFVVHPENETTRSRCDWWTPHDQRRSSALPATRPQPRCRPGGGEGRRTG